MAKKPWDRPEVAAKRKPWEMPPESPSMGDYASDMMGGLATGINKGVASIPGIPGTIEQLARMGINKVGGEGTVDPESFLPNANDTIGYWEALSGKLPEQTTTAGKYAESVGEFIPGGTGSIGRKLATAAAGGTLSKAVGDATDSPLGNLAGGLLGTLLARGRRGSPARALRGDRSVPTHGELFNQTNEAFRNIDNMNIQHPIADIQPMLDNIEQLVGNREASRLTRPKSTGLAQQLEAAAGPAPQGEFAINPITNRPMQYRNPPAADTRTVPHTLVEAVRRQTGELTRNALPEMATERNLAGNLRTQIDALNADNPQLQGVLPRARELGRRRIVDRGLGEIDRKSDFYKAGSEAGLENQALTYLRKHSGNLSDMERAAIGRIGHPDTLTKALSAIGKLGPNLTAEGSRNWLGPILSYTVAPPLFLAGMAANPIVNRRMATIMENARRTARAGVPGQQAATATAAAHNTARGASVPGGVVGSLISSRVPTVEKVDGGYMINGKFTPVKKKKAK